MFGINLKKYRKAKGLTQEDLALRINDLLNTDFKKNNVQSWENRTNPKLEVIVAICEILGIPEQFLFDDSDSTINKIVAKKSPEIKQMVEHTLRVPLYDGYVGAGSSGVINGFNDNFVCVDYISIAKKYIDKPIIAITVIGDSMTPYVNEDDIILFHPIGSDYKLKDDKYVIQTQAGVMVKNLSLKINGDIVISSCNKDYSDEIINCNDSQEHLEVLGVVVGRILKS